MTVNHEWHECRPVLLSVRGPGDLAINAQYNAAMQTAWSKLSDNDRKAFHRFTCYNDRDEATMMVIARFSQAIDEAMQ